MINWHGFEDTKLCLSSLAKFCKDFEVLLLENGSGEEEKLRSVTGGRVSLLVSSENLGFAGGSNLLIREAQRRGAEAIYLLNNDAEATEGFLDEPLKILDDSEVGFVQSKVLLAGTDRIENAGHRHLNSGDVLPEGRGKPAFYYSRNRRILSGCAAGLLIRSKMIDEIGLFDESFFINYEDVDLTYRATTIGWKGFYCASSVIHHRLNRSVKDIRDDEYYIRAQVNANLAYLRNTPSIVIALNSPWILVRYIWTAVAAFLMGGRLSRCSLKAIARTFSKRNRLCAPAAARSCRSRPGWFFIWRMQRSLLSALPSMVRSTVSAI